MHYNTLFTTPRSENSNVHYEEDCSAVNKNSKLIAISKQESSKQKDVPPPTQHQLSAILHSAVLLELHPHLLR
jgi:hypothetical protein